MRAPIQIWWMAIVCAVIGVSAGGAAAVAALGSHQSLSSGYVIGYLVVAGLAMLAAGGAALYAGLRA